MDQKQTQTQALDYSSLQGVVTKEMRTQFFARYPAYKRLQGISIALVSVVLMVSYAIFLMFEGGRYIFVALLLMSFMGLVVAVLYSVWKKQVDQRVKLQAFAERNRLTYKFRQKDPTYSGLIFNEGHSRTIIDALELPNYEVGNFQYETGSGKNRQIHSFGYIKMKLLRPIPHMVLDAKQNDLFRMISNLPVSFSTSQTLKLEGDFSKYFTLYVPETYERDALYILTPDVMASLIDESSPYDLEALGNELYLYRGQHFDLTSPTSHEGIAKHVNALNTEFVDQASGYKDERVAFGTQGVAEQGAKLRTRIHPLTIVIGVFVLGYFVFSYIVPFLMYLGS
ncbi:MAG: hypothetical protein ABIR46_04200 [Candidatus Saccharimonadales bacterium]